MCALRARFIWQEADAAVDGRYPERPHVGERADVLDDLLGELAELGARTRAA